MIFRNIFILYTRGRLTFYRMVLFWCFSVKNLPKWKRTFCVKTVIVWGRKKLPCCIRHDFSRILCSRNCFIILVPVIYIRTSGSTLNTVYFQHNGFFFTLIGRPITWNGQWLIFVVDSVQKSHCYSQARAYTFGQLILLCEVPPQNQLRFDSWLFFAL